MQHQELSKKIKLSDIKQLHDYRGFKNIWVFTPCQDNNLHMGYIDDRFFAYTRQAYGMGIDIEIPETIIDYYLDKVFFQSEAIERDMIDLNPLYRSYKKTLDNYRLMYEKK